MKMVYVMLVISAKKNTTKLIGLNARSSCKTYAINTEKMMGPTIV